MSRESSSWSRVLLGALLLGALASGCKRGEPAPADPSFEALPGVEEVDGSLTRMVSFERQPVFYTNEDPIKGATEPLVTIVEYSDFECPICGGFATTLDELVLAYPDDVRVVFRQFPLAMHPAAEPAARASIAAQAQGRFWAMHDRLFRAEHQGQRDQLVDLAQELGLDPSRFGADLESQTTADRVRKEQEEGKAMGVRSTPNFFINGRYVEGALPPDKLRALVDQERQAAQQLVDAGSQRREVYARYMRAALDQHGGRRP